MTNNEKIKKIREIYQDFLQELDKLKDRANDKVRAEIKSIEKKEIDKILDKINQQF